MPILPNRWLCSCKKIHAWRQTILASGHPNCAVPSCNRLQEVEKGFLGMFSKRCLVVALLVFTAGWTLSARAGDLKITLPKRSHMTPVQRLNREGVDAVRKHSYEKAEILFYKAYLLDPDDPFTLNNLGYVSELQGQVERALRFYDLAGQQATDAVIAHATSPRVEGRTMKDALAVTDVPIQVNHDNVEAVRLLSQGHGPEADLLLQKALKSDPRNIFTLNNMGVAKEMEGESQAALQYYDEAAATSSDAAAVVTLNRAWRGKPVSEMAAQNAKNLRGRMQTEENPEVKVAQLNIRGVSALNRNDFAAADQDFRKAYALDPNNAFAVNNIGYLSEVNGDRETAQFFYERAETIGGPKTKVGLATRRSAEGLKLSQVSSDSDTKVEAKVQQERDTLRRTQHEPILLRRRDNSVVEEPATPPANITTPQAPPSQ
jgi:Flp pilus assembly protein TadD